MPVEKNDPLNMIEEERQHMLDKGFTLEGDDEYTKGQLALAAASYALPPDRRPFLEPPTIWPWIKKSWQPEHSEKHEIKSRIFELVKAGALIVAEIERLQRSKINYNGTTGSDEISEGEPVHNDTEGEV